MRCAVEEIRVFFEKSEKGNRTGMVGEGNQPQPIPPERMGMEKGSPDCRRHPTTESSEIEPRKGGGGSNRSERESGAGR